MMMTPIRRTDENDLGHGHPDIAKDRVPGKERGHQTTENDLQGGDLQIPGRDHHTEKDLLTTERDHRTEGADLLTDTSEEEGVEAGTGHIPGISLYYYIYLSSHLGLQRLINKHPRKITRRKAQHLQRNWKA